MRDMWAATVTELNFLHVKTYLKCMKWYEVFHLSCVGRFYKNIFYNSGHLDCCK